VLFLVEAVTIGLIPYLGGVAGAAVCLVACGACNGLGNVTFLTVLQKWVSPGSLGRVMGMIMLCAFGSFPLSVAVSGVLVRHLGPAPFFPIAGAVVLVAMLGGLTQRDFRTFGAVDGVAEEAQAANAAQDPKAALGSRK
jgi:sugar phosphate permease